MTEHEPWHPEAFLQNRYTRAYRRLVEAVKTENRTRITGEHAEHHIVPKSFYRSYCEDGWLSGDWDEPENRVLLTHNEHAWCHILLARRVTWGLGRDKMASAIRQMVERQRVTGRRITSIVLGKIMADADEAKRDTTVYTFANEQGTVFVGTRAQLTEWANIPGSLSPLFRSRPQKTAQGWMLVPFETTVEEAVALWQAWRDEIRNAKLVAMNRPETVRALATALRDDAVRTFANAHGTVFTGTRKQMAEFAGLGKTGVSKLFVQGCRTAKGWMLVPSETTAEEAVALWQTYRQDIIRRKTDPLKDERVYVWTHKTGQVFTGTRRELGAFAGLNSRGLNTLFCRSGKQTYRGWSATPVTQNQESEQSAVPART